MTGCRTSRPLFAAGPVYGKGCTGGGEKVEEPVRGLDAIAEFINDDGGRDRNEHTIKRL